MMSKIIFDIKTWVKSSSRKPKAILLPMTQNLFFSCEPKASYVKKRNATNEPLRSKLSIACLPDQTCGQ